MCAAVNSQDASSIAHQNSGSGPANATSALKTQQQQQASATGPTKQKSKKTFLCCTPCCCFGGGLKASAKSATENNGKIASNQNESDANNASSQGNQSPKVPDEQEGTTSTRPKTNPFLDLRPESRHYQQVSCLVWFAHLLTPFLLHSFIARQYIKVCQGCQGAPFRVKC